MLKLKIFFVLAGLLITVVMLRAVLLGVQLPERVMVKWSQVHDVESTSTKIADFLYPMLKQHKGLCLSGESLVAQPFIAHFKARLAYRNLSIVTSSPEQASPVECFSLQVRAMDPLAFSALCSDGDRGACAGLRAFKKLESKEKAFDSDWVSLYRVENKKAVLFYFEHLDI